jgi:hypothetical protein
MSAQISTAAIIGAMMVIFFGILFFATQLGASHAAAMRSKAPTISSAPYLSSHVPEPVY